MCYYRTLTLGQCDESIIRTDKAVARQIVEQATS